MDNFTTYKYQPISGIESLEAELSLCTYVVGKQRMFVEDFLIDHGIYSLENISYDLRLKYIQYVNFHYNLTSAQKAAYKSSLDDLLLCYLMPKFPKLVQFVVDTGIARPIRNKVLSFLLFSRISDPEQISYDTRIGFQQWLIGYDPQEYLKALDKIKQRDISIKNSLNPFLNKDIQLDDGKVFLAYHKDYEIAISFNFVQDKEDLLFDFTITASSKMKRQVIDMLNWVLHEKHDRHDRRERFLVPLKKLYLFCVAENVSDIELLDDVQIEKFRKSMDGHVGTKTNIYMQIVGNTKKHLFLNSKNTNWDATTWYLERFSFARMRVNPSREICSINFGQIKNIKNRRKLQNFLRYQIGLTDRSLQGIRESYYQIGKLLKWADKEDIEVLKIRPHEMQLFINSISIKGTQAESFNKMLAAIHRFFYYFMSKGEVSAVPFSIRHELRKVHHEHHNRELSTETQDAIMQALKHLPVDLRLMLLNLYCVPSRVCEICCLKGNAYRWENDCGWIRIYQFKSRTEKEVPIPHVLYDLMSKYIEEHHIKPEEYVFKNKKGGAYDAGTFGKKMKVFFNKSGIDNYTFRSHDFRHTIASYFYRSGIDITVIRELLGHKDTEMTMQYVDHLQEKIDNKNKVYFKDAENALYHPIKETSYE